MDENPKVEHELILRHQTRLSKFTFTSKDAAEQYASRMIPFGFKLESLKPTGNES